ncbi:plasmid mobilization protein, partial [Salinibacter ruber]|uniref:plasmid mobilization protein n=2 Tax=Salinibacter ruber TaxID=146919 RepID=UPI00216812CF
ARQQVQMSEQEEDQSQSKGGRPRKPESERRSLTHGLRLSPNEKKKLEQRAKRAGLNLSEYIRRRALGKKIQTKVEEEAIRQIRRAGVNLNQIAKWANQGRNEAVHSAAKSTIQEVKQAIRQLL